MDVRTGLLDLTARVPLLSRLSEGRRLTLSAGVLLPLALAVPLFAGTLVDGRVAIAWLVSGVLAAVVYTFLGEDLRAEHRTAGAGYAVSSRPPETEHVDPNSGVVVTFCAGYALLSIAGLVLRYVVVP